MMSPSSFLDLMDGKSDIRRFSRAEYRALGAAGVIGADEKVELLDGLVMTLPPQGADHAETIVRLSTVLVRALAGRAEVKVQLPFAASDYSEPVPDLLLAPIGALERGAHCIIEIAVTSQRRDRRKATIYAHAKVPQLVFVDVPRREARVFRKPHDGDYALIELYRDGAPIVVDAFADVTLDLAWVLPRGGIP